MRTPRLAPIVAVAAAVGCADADKTSGSPGGGPRGSRPALVELAPVRAGDLTDGWTFLGQVEPALEADLAAAAAGHVVSVNAREGDRVRKGQLLVTLDSARVRAELAAARATEAGLVAELEIAHKQRDRAKDLVYPTISEPERERFELAVSTTTARLETARAQVRQLQVALSQHSIRAPFPGVVRSRQVDPGAWVSVGQPVLGVVSLDDLEVHVDVSAELGVRVSPGERVELLAPSGLTAGRARTLAAAVAGVVPALDRDTRTMRVRLVPVPSGEADGVGEVAAGGALPSWLVAGKAVDVRFPITLSGDGVVVPADALIRGPVSTRVIASIDGVAVPIDVDVIATAKGEALVRGDRLAPGVDLVVRGNERLRPGQPLRSKSPGGGEPGRPPAGADSAAPSGGR